MTETSIFKKDNRRFGGIIYSNDYETSRPNGNIAKRIANDLRFDDRCKRNSELRDRYSKKGILK